jgi:hypothetical protein
MDEKSYEQRGILFPENEYGIDFDTLSKCSGRVSFAVEVGTDSDKHYTLHYIDEKGVKQSVSFTNSHPVISEPELSWPIKGDRKRIQRFEEWSWLGNAIKVGSEGRFTLVPKPEHQDRPITIKTCYTNRNHFGTRHLIQRVYCFVEGVKHPFATLQICCTI